ncbi:MAG TPA: methyltransferase domain-containing protein [Thiotrichaceae bacterium]|nr:methyltransferase domain-containing protein [Thiotrichaceae bacterium]
MSRVTHDFAKELQLFSSPRNNIKAFQKLFDDCHKVLDIGCGNHSPLMYITPPHTFCVGIEKYKPDLEIAKQSQTHDEFYELDALNCKENLGENQFDICVAFDVIEHFTKKEGLQLLADMEQMASKRVIIFTPNGFLPQQGFEKGDFQEHLSGWDVDEMRTLGYNVIGLNGLKSLRTQHYRLKYKPQAFWVIVSWLTQFYCRNHPHQAAAILCWKNIKNV